MKFANYPAPVHELAASGDLYYVCSQAATAVSVALATTYTGLCLSNPAASGVEAILWGVGTALSLAPAAIAPLGLQGGWAAAGITVHTTPLVWGTAAGWMHQGFGLLTMAAGNAPKCLYDAACTTVGPKLLMPLVSGFTAAALPAAMMPCRTWLDGSIVLQPGGWVAIYALTAVTGLWSLYWSERTKVQ